jgi:hypothetical protein
MQPVYNDGRIGDIEPFDLSRLNDLLEEENVDHVNIVKLINDKIEKLPDKETITEERVRELIREEILRSKIMEEFNKLS